MEDSKKLKAGVAIDQWKLRTYKRAIENEGFTVKEVTPDKGSGFALITVDIDPQQKDILIELLKKLERKYSQRNRMN